MRKIILTIAMFVQFVYAQNTAVSNGEKYAKALELRVTKIVAPLNIEKKRKSGKSVSDHLEPVSSPQYHSHQ